MLWITSGAFPSMGASPFMAAVLWFAGVCVVCALAYFIDRAYRQARLVDATFDPQAWMGRYTAALALLSSSWASLIWVFWIPGNQINQMALALFVIAGIMNGVVARINRFQCYLYGSGTAFLIMWLHFLVEKSDTASIFSIVLPLLFLALTSGVRTASGQIRVNIKTQIENEILKDENARARDDAERASRMKSAFLANMSHELRTPLNAILGFSEIISSEAFGPDARARYREYAGDINDSGRHLLKMINELLDVAKIEAGKLELQLETVDTRDSLQQAIKLVSDQAQAKGVPVTCTIDPLVEKICVDERSFRQIAINLLSNAVKFTDRGSIEISLEAFPGEAVLFVRDTGCGIADAQVSRVFEPFEQVDNRYTKSNTGTGLGLTLVRALAKLHGGECRIVSHLGKGTTVSVSFPQGQLAGLARSGSAQARVA